MAAVIEQSHDANGIVWPISIAPFHVHVLPVNVKDAAARERAEGLAAELTARGIEVLLDDRDERPGAKFKDADLIGVPYRITIGKKLPEGIVELVERRPKRSTDVPIAQVVDAVQAL